MNLEHLQRTLLAAARKAPPSDRVPLAFERRVMAHLRPARPDCLADWSAWLWRSAMSACALALITGAISYVQADLPLEDAEPTLELANRHLEDALFAPDIPVPETW